MFPNPLPMHRFIRAVAIAFDGYCHDIAMDRRCRRVGDWICSHEVHEGELYEPTCQNATLEGTRSHHPDRRRNLATTPQHAVLFGGDWYSNLPAARSINFGAVMRVIVLAPTNAC